MSARGTDRSAGLQQPGTVVKETFTAEDGRTPAGHTQCCLARRSQETREELAKIKKRVDHTVQNFELHNNHQALETLQQGSMEFVEDMAQLEALVGNPVMKKKYQQQLTVFIVGYQEACLQRTFILSQLNEFFIQNAKAGEEESLSPSTEPEPQLDLDDVAFKVTEALTCAENATLRLAQINKEIISIVNGKISSSMHKRPYRELETAVDKARVDILKLTDRLVKAQTELKKKEQRVKELQRQNEGKSQECQSYKSQLDTTKSSLASLRQQLGEENTRLQADVRRHADRIAELEGALRERSQTPAAKTTTEELNERVNLQQSSPQELQRELLAREGQAVQAAEQAHEEELRQLRHWHRENRLRLPEDDWAAPGELDHGADITSPESLQPGHGSGPDEGQEERRTGFITNAEKEICSSALEQDGTESSVGLGTGRISVSVSWSRRAGSERARAGAEQTERAALALPRGLRTQQHKEGQNELKTTIGMPEAGVAPEGPVEDGRLSPWEPLALGSEAVRERGDGLSAAEVQADICMMGHRADTDTEQGQKMAKGQRLPGVTSKTSSMDLCSAGPVTEELAKAAVWNSPTQLERTVTCRSLSHTHSTAQTSCQVPGNSPLEVKGRAISKDMSCCTIENGDSRRKCVTPVTLESEKQKKHGWRQNRAQPPEHRGSLGYSLAGPLDSTEEWAGVCLIEPLMTGGRRERALKDRGRRLSRHKLCPREDPLSNMPSFADKQPVLGTKAVISLGATKDMISMVTPMWQMSEADVPDFSCTTLHFPSPVSRLVEMDMNKCFVSQQLPCLKTGRSSSMDQTADRTRLRTFVPIHRILHPTTGEGNDRPKEPLQLQACDIN
nr:PREDICTED: uncharacterized protein LOC107076955 isoform X1 [Lepisosteus oculatus]